MLNEVVDAVPEVRSGRAGGPRFRPKKLYADKGYDYARCRVSLWQRGIIARIARRGVESSEKLGRHRWSVERTQGWVSRYRKLEVRYELYADIYLAFLLIACSLIGLKQLHRLC